jgi:S-adenosylmethionine:tRNA ribosyltransferase-isomerase
MLDMKIEETSSQNVLERMVVANESPVGRVAINIPPELEANEPPEARGLERDQVRLMVSHYLSDGIQHAAFRDFPEFLKAGDVLVINTSGTMNAAVNARRVDGTELEVHFSTHLPDDVWTVELRSHDNNETRPFFDAVPGEILQLPGRASLSIISPYLEISPSRLWFARFQAELPIGKYLEVNGFPIRYNYVRQAWPGEYYQTVYATEKRSAEMPSAGRGFTPEIITRLVAKGVQVVTLILHTGVSSHESHEPPYEEYYRVPEMTAKIVNSARSIGNRVVAVGTTSIRALETVTDASGVTHAGEGWTDLVISANDQIRSVNCLLTGMHEPEASHLDMLEALAGRRHINMSYREALQSGLLWHEFGDLHLLMP